MGEQLLDRLIDRPDDEPAGGWLEALARAVNEINDGEDRGRIERAIDRVRQAAEIVCSKTGAAGFSISVGLPRGIAVELQWTAKREAGETFSY